MFSSNPIVAASIATSLLLSGGFASTSALPTHTSKVAAGTGIQISKAALSPVPVDPWFPSTKPEELQTGINTAEWTKKVMNDIAPNFAKLGLSVPPNSPVHFWSYDGGAKSMAVQLSANSTQTNKVRYDAGNSIVLAHYTLGSGTDASQANFTGIDGVLISRVDQLDVHGWKVAIVAGQRIAFSKLHPDVGKDLTYKDRAALSVAFSALRQAFNVGSDLAGPDFALKIGDGIKWLLGQLAIFFGAQAPVPAVPDAAAGNFQIPPPVTQGTLEQGGQVIGSESAAHLAINNAGDQTTTVPPGPIAVEQQQQIVDTGSPAAIAKAAELLRIAGENRKRSWKNIGLAAICILLQTFIFQQQVALNGWADVA